MELKQLTSTTANSMTSSEQSYEISKEAKALGLVVRYDTIKYRGQEVNFLSDPAGVRCYAQWNSQLIDLGLNNIYYKEDICKFIDRQLDLITDFRDCQNFVGAKLEYFHNSGYRDIKLSYKGRILKIFLVAGPVNENWIISESQKILISSGLLEDML
jgi:hypothetical protein